MRQLPGLWLVFLYISAAFKGICIICSCGYNSVMLCQTACTVAHTQYSCLSQMATTAEMSKWSTVIYNRAGADCWLVVPDIKSWLTLITVFQLTLSTTAGIVQSVQQLITGCIVQIRTPVGTKFSGPTQTGPEAQPASCTLLLGLFLGNIVFEAWR